MSNDGDYNDMISDSSSGSSSDSFDCSELDCDDDAEVPELPGKDVVIQIHEQTRWSACWQARAERE